MKRKNKGVWPDADAEEVILSAAESPFSSDLDSLSTAELAESLRRLVLLYDLGRQIWEDADDQDVFGTILSAISTLMDVERAFIATVAGGRLVPCATYGIDLGGEMDQWPVSSTMLRRVLEEGIFLLATDAMHDAKYGKVTSVDLHSIRSVICCPLGTKRKQTGLVYVDNRILSGVFSRSDLEFLSALTHYAGLAIETSRKRRQDREARVLAEARWHTLSKELSASSHVIAVSAPMVQLYGQVKRVSQGDVPVMLVGETGTGKEVFARLIHDSSPRSSGPFVAIHVGSLSTSVMESELFGHEKGAFTGADQRRIGRFELARGGTLFLDEILDIPLDVQPKLLRVLEQRTFERVGGNESVQADVRIICACNKPPAKCVAEGLFREDLYYRLNSVILEIPPLRDHPDDIIPLVHHFLEQCGSDKTFDEEALTCLESYRWPGNVRELKNLVEALDALVEGVLIRKADLPDRMRDSSSIIVGSPGFESLAEVVARVEKQHILRAIDQAGGKDKEAIGLLGISRAKFYDRKKIYGL